MTKDIMDVKEIAEYLGFSPTKIYRMLTSGEIPNVKVGGQYRFPRPVIDDWLNGKLEVPGSTRSTKSTKSTKSTRSTESDKNKVLRVEDEIVSHLVVFNDTGAASEKRKARKVMAVNLDTLDWQYLAGQAESAGVLAAAIAIEKEINRTR